MSEFLKGFLTEDNGKSSYGRGFSGLIIVTTLALVVFVTLKDGKLPEMGGPSLLLGVAVALYTGNKISSAIENK